MKVLVTGASGFVGSAVMRDLANRGIAVRGAYRRKQSVPAQVRDFVVVGEVNDGTCWRKALAGVSHVIHLVAVTHGDALASHTTEEKFRRVNLDGTRNLAEQAARAGVDRFVFLSSIKVNGEVTNKRRFQPEDAPRPQDIYGQTKLEAEEALRRVCRDSSMKQVVFRVPLVYGANVKGNFSRLVTMALSRWPLPLALIENRRSLLGIDNLCDALVHALDATCVDDLPLLISDGDDLSTPQLIRIIAAARGRDARLFSMRPAALEFVARATGYHTQWLKLASSLQLEPTDSFRRLGWSPTVNPTTGIERAINGIEANERREDSQFNKDDPA